MDDFDELQKLRRLKELEAKAAAEGSVMDSVGQPKGVMDTVSEYVPDSLKNIGSSIVKGLGGIATSAADAGMFLNDHLPGNLKDRAAQIRAKTEKAPKSAKTMMEAQAQAMEDEATARDTNPSLTQKLQWSMYQPKTQGEKYLDQGVQ